MIKVSMKLIISGMFVLNSVALAKDIVGYCSLARGKEESKVIFPLYANHSPNSTKDSYEVNYLFSAGAQHVAMVIPNSIDLSTSYLTVVVTKDGKEYAKLRYGANLEKTEVKLLLDPSNYSLICKKR